MTVMPVLAPELKVSQWLNTNDPITLAGLRGKVVVIEVFQMLCPGCVSHGLPLATRVLEAFSPQDVVVLGLHSVFEHREAQGSRAALQAFLFEYRIRFPVAIDAHTEGRLLPDTMQAYHLQGTPSLVLIDRQGQVAQTHLGVVSELALGAQIMRLIVA